MSAGGVPCRAAAHQRDQHASGTHNNGTVHHGVLLANSRNGFSNMRSGSLSSMGRSSHSA